jgi:glycosyltransferase involved in cell wall biosynthesis
MRALNGILFFPRGGSSHVTRSLSVQLPAHGWDVRILSGSLPGGAGDAERFYRGLDLRTVEFGTGSVPMQPSYEDRPGAPDRCFALVDDTEYRAHVAVWRQALREADAESFDVLLLNHLTPLNEAAAQLWPELPIVGHLHGTELMMLEQIVAGAPPHWTHADAWNRRMRRWARQCTAIVVQTPRNVDRAVALLGIDRRRCVVVANGFDPTVFVPRTLDRPAVWREALLEQPQGWRPGAPPGSIVYEPEQVEVLNHAVVFVAVGRYTAVKRIGLLIEAFTRAQRRVTAACALVIVGGHPGEWEGEHPWDAVARCRAPHVFLAGWHEQSAVARLLNAADLQVLASVREQFGLVLVEGMACGLPAIAVNRLGPAEIVDDGQTGWLVEPDDIDQLTDAIVAGSEDGPERRRRGRRARNSAVTRWSWPSLAGRIADTLDESAQTVPARACA